ncbi:uncharacterized protein MONOS_3994 [Monocercomonoides exilis]|uniref:uncharacterized protein n=1 Tax=Monocercomonoides exilis TaxID=2049356 RepID=UPI0035597479|nr:hypothetical protein MONOS_3994 [Monocercomonoides exilis]|eukprot:MONOS_3994.1-p1 / transcript=MONOS_3994.1 / gene=MONOS_3994 / organism=Monocercomonoides_exilis_PA203 / gene_product=unspecified product / transcript_product=unspecified product / location=Mono_scaffold00100:71758-72057(-) / protein_length=100 / sequence_SO=supercontig / SO=protein_coding / is_pseudo=false
MCSCSSSCSADIDGGSGSTVGEGSGCSTPAKLESPELGSSSVWLQLLELGAELKLQGVEGVSIDEEDRSMSSSWEAQAHSSEPLKRKGQQFWKQALQER